MKRNLKYEVPADCMDMDGEGLMQYREQAVVSMNGGISHTAGIITYVVIRKGKMLKMVPPTNDFDMPMETVIAIYSRRLQTESLLRQTRQDFPLRCRYRESANAVKIQIWGEPIANLLLSLLQGSHTEDLPSP